MIRNIPDFPQKGILFRDITPILQDSQAFHYVIDKLTENYKNHNIDVVVAIEARGYIFGGALAYNLGAGFVPVRKPGKLPYEVITREYSLEYGVNRLDIHKDAIRPGNRVLIFDDLIATGGTAKASAELVEALGGKVVEFAFVIELLDLKGREFLSGYKVFSLVQY